MSLDFDPARLDRLPAGRHRATLAEVRRAFVDAFPGSSTRPVVLSQCETLLEAISRVIGIEDVWIDGSFVTDKLDPNDIDLVSHFDGEALNRLDAAAQMLLSTLVAGHLSRDLYACDLLFIAQFPVGHPARGAYEKAFAYWDNLFGTHRDGNPKGYVELDLA